MSSIHISGPHDKNCWSVNYVSRRICALQGSSVDISSQYSHPNQQLPKFKFWYKLKRSGKVEELTKVAGLVEYHDNRKNQHILRINNLKKNDSAEYAFRPSQQNVGWKQCDLPGVTLVVTGNSVEYMRCRWHQCCCLACLEISPKMIPPQGSSKYPEPNQCFFFSLFLSK